MSTHQLRDGTTLHVVLSNEHPNVRIKGGGRIVKAVGLVNQQRPYVWVRLDDGPWTRSRRGTRADARKMIQQAEQASSIVEVKRALGIEVNA